MSSPTRRPVWARKRTIRRQRSGVSSSSRASSSSVSARRAGVCVVVPGSRRPARVAADDPLLGRGGEERLDRGHHAADGGRGDAPVGDVPRERLNVARLNLAQALAAEERDRVVLEVAAVVLEGWSAECLGWCGPGSRGPSRAHTRRSGRGTARGSRPEPRRRPGCSSAAGPRPAWPSTACAAARWGRCRPRCTGRRGGRCRASRCGRTGRPQRHDHTLGHTLGKSTSRRGDQKSR